jgi:sec-independent protein translocase protein TatC
LIKQRLNTQGDTVVMTFFEHFRELKKRIILVTVFFIVSLLLSYFSTPFLLDVIKQSAETYLVNLNVFKVTESVSIYAKLMFIQSICITIPFIILQLYNFVKPSMNLKIKKSIMILSPIVSLLFSLGLVMGYIFLVPILVSFFLGVTTEMNMNTVYSFSDFFQFVFMICVICGSILQLPPLLILLVHLKIINCKTLAKLRLSLYVFFTFIGILITPPDFISDIIAILLMIFMFEISLIISRMVEEKVN